MKLDDNRKNRTLTSSVKPRVSFSLPIETLSGDGNDFVLGDSNAVRLTRQTVPISKLSDKRSSGFRDNGKSRPSELRKAATVNQVSAPLRSCGVKKYLVRDTELTVPSLTSSQYLVKSIRGQGILKNKQTSSEIALTAPNCNTSNCQLKCRCRKADCSSPELLSSLCIAKKIQKTSAALKEPRANIYTLHPLVEQEIEEKASNRLNFPFDELVYRDLVTLNIRDEEYSGLNRDKCKCYKDFEPSRLKDEEPVLSDFYQPQFGEEYSSVIYPVPFTIDKVRRFNGLSIYNKMHFWELM